GTRMVALGYGFCLALTTIIKLRQANVSNYRLKIASAMSILFVLAIAALAWSFLGGGVPWGGSVEAIFELLLFTLVAATLAFEFAATYIRQDEFKSLINQQTKSISELEVDRSIA